MVTKCKISHSIFAAPLVVTKIMAIFKRFIRDCSPVQADARSRPTGASVIFTDRNCCSQRLRAKEPCLEFHAHRGARGRLRAGGLGLGAAGAGHAPTMVWWGLRGRAGSEPRAAPGTHHWAPGSATPGKALLPRLLHQESRRVTLTGTRGGPWMAHIPSAGHTPRTLCPHMGSSQQAPECATAQD